MTRRTRTSVPGPTRCLLALALLAGTCAPALDALGRQMPVSPVFVNDSPRAADAIVRAGELAAIGNLEEAARVLQSLLDGEGERMIATAADPDLFTTVRTRVMAMLAGSPPLLERYRAIEEAEAERLVQTGEINLAERTRLMTPAGYEAALRIAQQRLEAAQFDAALLMLESLSGHPDRTGDSAEAATALLRSLASLTRTSRTGARAEALLARWSAAGETKAAETPEIPVPRSVFDRLAPSSLDGILSRPLWSDSLGERLPLTASAASQRAGIDLPETARWLFAVPSVVGDTVYVSDTQTITAWNRFTLSQRWRVKFDGAQGRQPQIGPQSGFEELAQVASDGRTVASVIGLAIQGNTSIRRTLVSLDAATGQVRWSRTLTDLGLLDTSQPGNLSALIGPAMLDQDVIVAGIRRSDQGRRLDGYSAIGVDANTGELRWNSSIASAGSLAYGVTPGVVDAPAVRDGIVHVVSSVGFAAAFESTSGRVHWIRRLPAGAMTQDHPNDPWESNTPVLLNDSMYIVHPGRQEVLSLDAATGAMRQRMATGKLDNAAYLLASGDKLLGVSSASIVVVDASTFGPGASTTRIARFTPNQLRGRIVVAGGKVLAPVVDGVEFYDPASSLAEPQAKVPLSRPGNILPIESQLLVVDDHEIHTYLLWEEAERMLREQMAAHPGEPAPAITYAELAYRASKPDVIVGAVDRAITAIEADPLRGTNTFHQARLFRALFEMIEPSAASQSATLASSLRGELIERLGRCASTKQEQVSHLLVAGAFYDAAGQADRAVQSYQRVLDVRELAETSFSQGETTVSAEFEATRRLRRAISTHGAAVYAAYQADAARLLAEAAGATEPEPFERIARRYPVAPAAVDAWIKAASRHAGQGRPKLAGQSLEEGLATARFALSPEDPRQGELAGRLVRHLIDTGLLHPARTALQSFLRDTPNATLTVDGVRVDASAMLAEVSERLARLNRRPALGANFGRHRQMLGWGVMEPVAEDAPRMTTDRVILVNDKGEMALFTTAGPEPLTKLWSAEPDEEYIAMDSTGVLLAAPSGQGDASDFEFLRRDLETGELKWRSGAFRTLLDRGPIDDLLASADNPIAPRIETPLSAATPVTSLTTAFDQQTMVVMDKIGRSVAFDIETGRLLWKSGGIMPRIHAIALEAGTLLVAGADGPVDFTHPERDSHASDTMPAVITVIDARSGQTVTQWTGEGRVRWARLSPEGFPIVGLDSGVMSLDPYRGTVRWRAAGKDLRSTLHGWTLPGRVIVRDEGDRLWQISTADGSVPYDPLDLRGRMNDGFGTLNITDMDGRTCIRTRLGLVLLDEKGRAQGADSRDNDFPLSFIGIGRDQAVTLSLEGTMDDVNQSRYALNVYELGSLKAIGGVDVMLPSNTDIGACDVVDGRVLITTGSIVTVIELNDQPGP